MPDDFILFAQQALRLGTGYDWVMLASRILHILGAIILVGGLFYLWAVVTPVSAPAGASPVDQHFGGRRAAWAKWIGIASALLLITGLWNFIQMVKTYQIATSYHMMGGIKILLAVAFMLLASVLAGRTSLAESFRQKWRLWLSTTLILGILLVALGSVMRTYQRTEKLPDTPGPTLIAP